MKVVIFCGGLGTRLKEETEYRPKPMVNIGDKPILWHIMKIYSHYGFNDFVLCLGYKGDIIKQYFYDYEYLNNDFTVNTKQNEIKVHRTDNSEWNVTLVDTGNSLKGSRLKRIEKYIDSNTFMATYGDGVGNVNIFELLKEHKRHNKIVTITGVMPPARFGIVSSNNGIIDIFTEKTQIQNEYINGGFFAMDKRIFDYVTLDTDCDLEIGVFDKLAEKQELAMYKHPDKWMCMDTPRDVELLNKLWNSGKAFWKVWE